MEDTVMAKSVDGLSKLIAIYCGMTAIRDGWDEIDDETRDVIRGNKDLSGMMEIAEGFADQLKDWNPDQSTLRLIGALEIELNKMTEEAAAATHS
jgi:hypothetical protein